MIINYVKDYHVMSVMVADIVEKLISPTAGMPHIKLGLPTGGTPIGMYKSLVERNLTWSAVTTFNLDEYIDIDPDHPESYKNFMWRRLHMYTNINEENIRFPNLNYDDEIQKAGGLDLTILGLGSNGHIAFNEPSTSFNSTTRIVNLTQQTIRDNSRFFDSIDDVPTQAITMGLKTIMDSKEIILMVHGEHKLDILLKSIWGPTTTDLPASVLKTHENVRVFYCD
jgi:glucosamine-6-phosphate deaminase